MQALRLWQARRLWARLQRTAQRRPQGPARWTPEARVLLLYDRDQAGIEPFVERLTWSDFGIDASAKQLVQPERIVWSSTPDKTPERPDHLWTPAQLNFAGLVRTEVAAPWLQREYDLVVNLLARPFMPFDHFCAAACAHLRVALHDGVPGPYDVMVCVGADRASDESRSALGRYLRVLNPHHAR